MDISVDDITSVDKEVTIKADRSDLEPKIKKALKDYQKKIELPGFRPGRVPTSLIRKRYGKEIEQEQINEYIQEVYNEQVVPEHDPVGQPQVEDFQWEDEHLQVKMKIGVKPDFELVEPSSITVDKMVHDVSDEEVEEELEKQRERAGNWEETDEAVAETSKVLVDAYGVDEKGNRKEEDVDADKELDLNDPQNEEFKNALQSKKPGDTVDVKLGEGDDAESFQLAVKKVYKLVKPEMDDTFAAQASNGEAQNLEEFRSLLKSRMQDYYDRTAQDMARQDLREKLIEAYSFEVPEVIVDKVMNSYVDRLKQQNNNQLPEDFDEQQYKESMRDEAVKEGRWTFIVSKLEERYDDIELTAEDIDQQLASEAARYGVTTDMVKNFYAQSQDAMESLRQNIRTEKLFNRLLEEVSINELDKEQYQSKKQEEQNQQQQESQAT